MVTKMAYSSDGQGVKFQESTYEVRGINAQMIRLQPSKASIIFKSEKYKYNY